MFFSYRLFLIDGRFWATSTTEIAYGQWVHLAFVYHGPNEGEGISIYYNGERVSEDRTKHEISVSPSDENTAIVIGRRFRLKDSYYVSVAVDELMLWNRPLSDNDIQNFTDSDDCPDTNPCHNGGSCIDEIGNYYCECTLGFTGDTCEDTDHCLNITVCQNGGICENQQSTYICECPNDVYGTFCEKGKLDYRP